MNAFQAETARRGVAIVGLSGRYPGGAETPAKLWENLKAGIDAVGEARGDRWDLGHHHPDPARPERVYTRACGLLERIDAFDHEFFGLSPREARQVDPQQRLLLELAWEALEDASIPRSRIAGTDAGVFVGISSNDYASLVGPQGPDAYSNTGSSFSIAANRISYFLDLHGPSMAIDTACSSTIVGVHQACTSLLAGDCSIALAGGISLLVHIRPWLGFAKASMLSPTGRCKSFDASGDGYVRSEGGGIAVLKTLEAAERDGDAIYGVILASGVNSDGHTLGLSMPNVDAQERLLRKVYAACGVPPEDVVYVEAHGTGTSVGDPIECESLGRVLGVPRADGSTCLVGSVKSNIGHLEAASGMAGLTKALLVLRHREIPANLHFKTPNPKIKFDEWKLEVVSTTRPLPERGKPVVVGVNSFGFGGTNAHLAIAEYRPPALEHRNGHATRRQNLLLLSGHTPEALRAVAEDYAGFLKTQPEAAWTEICAAAALCRSEHRHRLALAAESPAEAAQKLERWAAGEPVTRLATGSAGERRARVAFVYSGNGPQWWGMGRELMASVAQFRHEIERIDAIFQPLAGWSLVEEMRRPESESRTALTEYAQPLLFAQQVALGALLRSSGIAPAVTLGHSVGEVAAAYEAGALSLEQAVLVIYNRSLQQAKTAGMGTMAAIGMSSDEALQAMREIPGWLELAASNAPKAVTVAGDPAALEALRAAVTEAGKFARILPLQYAFHSTAMDAVKDDLLEALQALTPGAGTIPFLSTVDVETKAGPALGAQYWWRNVREPVRFYEAVDRLIAEGTGVFVEIGPHPVLRDYIVQCAKAREANVTALATLRRPAANRPEPELDNLWTAVCACFASGAGAPETIFTRPQPVPALPMYPWQRSRHWRGWTALPDQHHPVEREHPLLGYRISAGDGLWENTLDVNQLRYLRDHEVQGSVVFPAAAYVESGLAAARLLLGEGTLDLESFEILRPLTIPEHTDPLVQLAADAKDGTFAISSRADKHFGNWTQNVRGRLSRADVSHPPETLDLGALREKLPCRITASEHYAAAANRGLRYGPAFQGITNIWMSSPGEGPREALAEIELESLAEGALSPYLAHPSLTDSGVQVILSLIGQTERRLCSVIPVSIERVRSYAPVPNHFFCRVTIASESERSAVADFQMLDADGKLVLGLLGTRCQKVGFSSGSASSLIAEWWRPDPAAPDLFAQPLQLPEPGHVAAALGGDVGEALDEFDRRTFYRDVQPALDRLAGAYAVKALAELGAAGGPFDLARLMRRGRVKQQHARLLASVVEMAAADGQLGVEENGWVWNASRDPEEPARLWRELLQAHPRYLTELLLLARAGDELAATLRSDAPAEPHEGSGPLEQLFDSAPFQAVYNRLARALVR
ncbi:MAG: type I polyketide synthase, partial [Candidatus Baltobacteraceae bacterium]